MTRPISDLRPGDRVMALSLWQPWASLMATGAKTVETRSWSTSYRGPLLICASARKRIGELYNLLVRPAFRRGLSLPDADVSENVHRFYHRGPSIRSEIDALPFGQAVALVELYACNPTGPVWRGVSWEPPEEERPFGNYHPGRWAWMTRGLRQLTPFPVRGQQGLFEVELPGMEDWR